MPRARRTQCLLFLQCAFAITGGPPFKSIKCFKLLYLLNLLLAGHHMGDNYIQLKIQVGKILLAFQVADSGD